MTNCELGSPNLWLRNTSYNFITVVWKNLKSKSISSLLRCASKLWAADILWSWQGKHSSTADDKPSHDEPSHDKPKHGTCNEHGNEQHVAPANAPSSRNTTSAACQPGDAATDDDQCGISATQHQTFNHPNGEEAREAKPALFPTRSCDE